MAQRKFSDFMVGQTTASERFVNAELVEAFARVSGDYNPIHLDDAYAAMTSFGSRIAHGALIVSFVSGLLGTDLPGPGTVAISLDLKFRKPVYLNSTVVTRVEIIKIDNRRGFITLACVCKVEGEIVIKGEAFVNFPLDNASDCKGCDNCECKSSPH